MSLFPCPDCNNEISFSAKSCTDCGCVIKSYHIKNHLNTLYYSEKEIMVKDYVYQEKQRVTCDHCQESYQKYITCQVFLELQIYKKCHPFIRFD